MPSMARSNELCQSLSSVTSPLTPTSHHNFGVTYQIAVATISHNTAFCIGIFMPYCSSRLVNKCLVVKVIGFL